MDQGLTWLYEYKRRMSFEDDLSGLSGHPLGSH